MRWREALHPVGMQRVGAAGAARRAARPAGRGGRRGHGGAGRGRTVGATSVPSPAADRLQRLPAPGIAPAVAAGQPDLDAWEHAGRVDLIAGEAQLEHRAGQAVARGRVVALVGWMPVEELHAAGRPGRGCWRRGRPDAATRRRRTADLARAGGCRARLRAAGETYATVPYADLNPSLIAGAGLRGHVRHHVRRRRARRLLVLAALAIRCRVVVAAGAGCARSGCSWPAPGWRASSSGCCTASSSAPPTSYRWSGSRRSTTR